MGADPFIPEWVPCAKGWVPYCLEEASKGRGARARLSNLSNAITSIGPSYQGLETVFDTHLLSRCVNNLGLRERIVAHLKSKWFDRNSPDAYFPGQPVAEVYAQGVLKALELSLKGQRTVPINSWWIVDYERKVKMLTLADVDKDGVTIGNQVTLLILTPRPRGEGAINRTPILGEQAVAWRSEQEDDQVTTLAVKDLALTETGPPR